MSKKTVKKILITLVIILISLILFRVVLFDKVTIDTSNPINHYSDYYLYKKIDTSNFLFKTSKSKLWFLIGQKDKMLEKIKEDIITVLDQTTENNSDVLKGYEISDDVKKVTVYYYKDVDSVPLKINDKLDKKVRMRVQLYNEILVGWEHASYNGDIINYIAVEK